MTFVLVACSSPAIGQSDNLQRRIAHNKLQKWKELNRVGELTRKQLEKTMQRISKVSNKVLQWSVCTFKAVQTLERSA